MKASNDFKNSLILLILMEVDAECGVLHLLLASFQGKSVLTNMALRLTEDVLTSVAFASAFLIFSCCETAFAII
jgi:hypothetical protein